MSNVTRRDVLKGFAFGSLAMAAGGLTTGCAPTAPVSDEALAASGEGRAYRFAKRVSEVADRAELEADVQIGRASCRERV